MSACRYSNHSAEFSAFEHIKKETDPKTVDKTEVFHVRNGVRTLSSIMLIGSLRNGPCWVLSYDVNTLGVKGHFNNETISPSLAQEIYAYFSNKKVAIESQ